MVSSARDPRDCPDAVWLAVLGLASSELGLEIGRGRRKVKGTAPPGVGQEKPERCAS